MGYLVNVSITYITDAILSQQDITEDESIQLTELLRTLHPLEELFILEPGQVSTTLIFLHPSRSTLDASPVRTYC